MTLIMLGSGLACPFRDLAFPDFDKFYYVPPNLIMKYYIIIWKLIATQMKKPMQNALFVTQNYMADRANFALSNAKTETQIIETKIMIHNNHVEQNERTHLSSCSVGNVTFVDTIATTPH